MNAQVENLRHRIKAMVGSATLTEKSRTLSAHRLESLCHLFDCDWVLDQVAVIEVILALWSQPP